MALLGAATRLHMIRYPTAVAELAARSGATDGRNPHTAAITTARSGVSFASPPLLLASTMHDLSATTHFLHAREKVARKKDRLSSSQWKCAAQPNAYVEQLGHDRISNMLCGKKIFCRTDNRAAEKPAAKYM